MKKEGFFLSWGIIFKVRLACILLVNKQKTAFKSHDVAYKGWRRSIQVARRAAVRQRRVRASARAPQKYEKN